MGTGLFTNITEALVDDRQEHAHANKHHHQDEQAEHQRTQERCCFTQLVGIELHQRHLEQHLSRVQQRRAREQLAHEQQVEEGDERPEHHREHRDERQQISAGMRESLHEEHQTVIEPTETDELDRGEETRRCNQTAEDLVDIDSLLQVDIRIAMGLREQITDAIQLSIAPNVDAHAGPRTGNDAHIDVRPELAKIRALQLDQ